MPCIVVVSHILQATMDYLVEKVLMQSPGQEFVEIYNFIRDRGRALRKDFKVQNHLKGPECVNVLERLTRFLIHSDFVLCQEPESKYSWQQNRHQISDTLTTLMEVYDDEGQIQIRYQNEAEFRSYFILLTIDDPVPVDRLHAWRPEVIHHYAVQTALKFHNVYQNRNYRVFFRLIRRSDTTYLMACVLQVMFIQVRRDASRCLHASLSAKDTPLPMSSFINMFGLQDVRQAEQYCQFFGYEVVRENDGSMGVKVGKSDQSAKWVEPVTSFNFPKSPLIQQKSRDASHLVIVNGNSKESSHEYPVPSMLASQVLLGFTPQKDVVDVFGQKPASSNATFGSFGSGVSAFASFGNSTPPFAASGSTITKATPATFGSFSSIAPPCGIGSSSTSVATNAFSSTSTTTPTNVFGSSSGTNAQNAFGSTTTSATANVFGTSATAASTDTFSASSSITAPNVFGSSTTSAAANVFDLSSTSTASKVFGSLATAPATNVLGSGTSASNVFGTSPAVTGANLFGSASAFGRTETLAISAEQISNPSVETETSLPTVVAQAKLVEKSLPSTATRTEVAQNIVSSLVTEIVEKHTQIVAYDSVSLRKQIQSTAHNISEGLLSETIAEGVQQYSYMATKNRRDTIIVSCKLRDQLIEEVIQDRLIKIACDLEATRIAKHRLRSKFLLKWIANYRHKVSVRRTTEEKRKKTIDAIRNISLAPGSRMTNTQVANKEKCSVTAPTGWDTVFNAVRTDNVIFAYNL